jgi:hypothetical protein
MSDKYLSQVWVKKSDESEVLVEFWENPNGDVYGVNVDYLEDNEGIVCDPYTGDRVLLDAELVK